MYICLFFIFGTIFLLDVLFVCYAELALNHFTDRYFKICLPFINAKPVE